MESNKTFRIATFGLSTYESRVLQTICIISRNRPRTYEICDANTPEPADFAIVDRDDPAATADWERYQSTNPMAGAVMLTKHPMQGMSDNLISRPIMATRLLAILDNLQKSSESPAFAPGEALETGEMPSAAHPTSAEARSSSARGAWLTALVVDDSLPIRRQIQIELKQFVGKVDLAEDGEQALELIAEKAYDIVFLDVVLPGMDGYKICRTIKRNKSTKDTPVIMLTGKSSPFDRVKGKLAGCDTYLTKPVDHATFQKVVHKYLSQDEPALAGPTGGFGRTIPGEA